MAQKRETVFREKVREDLKSVFKCKSFPIQQKAIVGTPDFLLCIAGTFVALELKADEESPVQKMQVYNLNGVEECGGKSFVAYPQNWKNILTKLQKISNDKI
jgi:hypothetical protein